MARPAYTEKFQSKLAALKIVSFSHEAQEQLDAPLPQLDALWHYECVVSPRSPAAKLHSNPGSPRSPAAADHLQPANEAILWPASAAASGSGSPDVGIRPRSPSVISPRSPPHSPRSHASPPTSAAPSPLSRFAPAHQSLQRVFNTFDENGDGSVSLQEISKIFEKLGLERSEDSLKFLLAEMPSLVTKAQGHVDEEEFLLLYESACYFVEANASAASLNGDVDQDLLAAFHVFDKDGNGFISPAELQTVLCSLGFPQGRQLEDCVDMIARVDENGDGQVDFFEFKKLFHMENPFITTIQSF